jgi:hypothetical protein
MLRGYYNHETYGFSRLRNIPLLCDIYIIRKLQHKSASEIYFDVNYAGTIRHWFSILQR